MTQIVRTISACICACLLGQTLLAQSWSVAGNAGFSDGIVDTTDIAIDQFGVPYVVYFDARNGGKVTGKKFTGVERGMNNLPVNVQSLAAGIYMLSVKNADGIQTVRFIKK